MNNELILAPILGHIFLVMLIYVLLLVRKIKAAKAGLVDREIAAMDRKAWPADVVKASNNLDNQFEAPMMFYALCLILYLTQAVTTLTLVLAWFFLLSRYLHAFVHVTSNYVPIRMRVFASGLVALTGMAIVAACKIWSFYP